MDVREKLVELVGKARRYAANKCHSFMSCAECDHYGEHDGNCRNTYIAESLIAHGVTVQEWISVKDRLPKDDEIVIICTEKGFVYAGELIGDAWFLDNDSWTESVTHWMPLPEPPDFGADMRQKGGK